jgi:hypothetical protein
LGDDDQLGTLDLLTNERTRDAAALVTEGKVIPLGPPLEEPNRPPGSRRASLEHHMVTLSESGVTIA